MVIITRSGGSKLQPTQEDNPFENEENEEQQENDVPFDPKEWINSVEGQRHLEAHILANREEMLQKLNQPPNDNTVVENLEDIDYNEQEQAEEPLIHENDNENVEEDEGKIMLKQFRQMTLALNKLNETMSKTKEHPSSASQEDIHSKKPTHSRNANTFGKTKHITRSETDISLPNASEWKNMKDSLLGLQTGTTTKRFKFEEMCPYPFDTDMIKVPFPSKFEIPKYEKYKGKGDPRDHIKEFFMASQEVSYSDNYLLRLFPCSLGGQALEWFMHLPHGSIVTFADISEKFVRHFSYNVEHELTMLDLCNTKQLPGESFAKFLQRWRSLASSFPYTIPEKQMATIFVTNLTAEMDFHLQVHCAQTFDEIIEKGMIIEKALLRKGLLQTKVAEKEKTSKTIAVENPKILAKNKNLVGDGVTENKHVRTVQAPNKPQLTLQ